MISISKTEFQIMKLSTKWDLREDTMRSMLKAPITALGLVAFLRPHDGNSGNQGPVQALVILQTEVPSKPENSDFLFHLIHVEGGNSSVHSQDLSRHPGAVI